MVAVCVLLHLDECRMVALAILVRFRGVGESSTNDLAIARSNSHHFGNSEHTRPEPKDHSPTLILISITLTFRAGYLERVMAVTAVDSHPCEFHSFRHSEQKSRQLATFKEIRTYSCLLPPLV